MDLLSQGLIICVHFRKLRFESCERLVNIPHIPSVCLWVNQAVVWNPEPTE
jgi:hypothetical protein